MKVNAEELLNTIFEDLKKRLSQEKLLSLKESADCYAKDSPLFEDAWYIQSAYVLSSCINKNALVKYYACNNLVVLPLKIFSDF